MRILFLVSELGYGGAAKQMALLASGLARGRFEARVCVLGPAGPRGEALGRAGVPVEALGWRRFLDVRPFLTLRRLVRACETHAAARRAAHDAWRDADAPRDDWNNGSACAGALPRRFERKR